ncbi:molybdenum cofactor biosynthesis protein [Pseudodesulfovibrio sp. F-1]|uniref:Molybdopterin synthase catalytic subunit n=1 Tax=Pseudodesulfovibrio alkaliphilus TaxID=2661613 RepID=A0A7K1KS06_9BACT|nr:molybdenum cofactor biosynthesis protein MoaE [Pseudodesulfovibrio alkaliphilus]MUM78661.1 molybdenum cofactor biosynthesis protein [Pseudodesulfovibrio alkaliphilus]
MDISKAIAELKREPGFADNVGMILVHNGVVRAWSRKDRTGVSAIEVTPDLERIEAIRREIEAREGIFRAVAHAKGGLMHPGDDVLFLIVAGDIRENVKPALAEFLDRVKAEAVTKREVFVDERADA